MTHLIADTRVAALLVKAFDTTKKLVTSQVRYKVNLVK